MMSVERRGGLLRGLVARVLRREEVPQRQELLLTPINLSDRAFRLIIQQNPGETLDVFTGEIQKRGAIGRVAEKDYFITQEAETIQDTTRDWGYKIVYTGFYKLESAKEGDEPELLYRIGHADVLTAEGRKATPSQLADINMIFASLENQLGVNRNLAPRVYNS